MSEPGGNGQRPLPAPSTRGDEVGFDVGGHRVVGRHLVGRGARFATAAGRPCVVMAHGFGGTVDSGLLPFATTFAAAGLDVLAFDYRHFGASEGEPRQLLSISAQLEDYAAAVGHARGLEGVDPDRIVLWGVSYSGGHVLRIAARDGRVAAVVALTPAVDGRATMREGLEDGDRRVGARLLRAAVADRVAAKRGRPPTYVPLAAPPGQLGVLTAPGAHEAYTGIAGPTWRNRVAARILLRAASYRPIQDAGSVAAPVLVQIADHDRSASPRAAQRAATRCRSEVRHYPCDHFDVHVGGAWHAAACEDQLAFLRRHLEVATAASSVG
jgi:uncharacterized protein